MSKGTRKWRRLDNAAKIFPSTANKHDTKVFRFACELFEDIDVNFLQEALNKTMEEFPIYKCIMKKGLFWYYLEETSLKPTVTEENDAPCKPLYDANVKKLLFRVTYYKKRINLEIYHVLSDGTGAVQFLKTIVYKYLLLKYKENFTNGFPKLDYDASTYQKIDDSFQKYYDKTKRKTEKFIPAYQLKGEKVSEFRMQIMEGILSVGDALKLSRENNVTLTALIIAVFLKAVYEEMPVGERKKPVSVEVPANLRKYFKSESARNFFGTLCIRYNFAKESDELKDIMQRINVLLKEELTPEKLQLRMNSLIAFEKNFIIRLVPLFIKNIVLKTVYDFAQKGTTISVSNIGQIKMPDEMKKYIRLFDVFTGTNRTQICMCSYEDNLVISFTSAFVNTDIQRRFFRMLSDLGLKIEIVSNRLEEN